MNNIACQVFLSDRHPSPTNSLTHSLPKLYFVIYKDYKTTQHITNHRTRALEPRGTLPKLDRDRMVGERGKYLVAPNSWQEKFCETAEIKQCVRKNL